MSLALRWEKSVLPGWSALVYTLIAVLTIQGIPETAAASLSGNDPGSIEPGWSMANMLLVPTFQVRYPILRFILMKTDDLALHGGLVYS
jgi:hypothetical protein